MSSNVDCAHEFHHALLPLRGCGESQGLRPLPPAPQHDVMVLAGRQVLGFWLGWLLDFGLSRWSLDVSSQK